MARRRHFEGDGRIDVTRDAHGVPHVVASSEADLYRGLGYCHGVDRALPLLLTRILGQGRGSELLDAGDDMLATDRFFRRLNLGAGVAEEVARVDPHARDLAEAYCDGVNRALAESLPWELRLLRYRPAAWTLEDSLLVSRVVGYVALAQSQGDVERLFLEMLQAGVPRAHLVELFPGLVDEADCALLRRVRLGARLVPDGVRWSNALPRVLASNNWALAPRKTAGGHALAAYDPHLEVNRLPPIWYEIVLELGARYCMVATMPGLPGLLIGRTNDLAWGATYTFMDAIDSWIEDCRDGCYRRVVDGRESWEPFRVRTETIRRARKPAVTVRFHENDHGVLDGDPSVAGLYLATRWATATGTGAASLAAGTKILHAPDVAAGMELLGQIETAWNWVLADRHGNIGYQMSGRMPLRRAGWSGFAPVPGWEPANDWQGFVPPADLPCALNPATGFIATANQDLNHLGRARPINMPMGPYRADRIAHLLAARDGWTVADVRAMQMDVLSPQAERFMEILRPRLPATPAGEILRRWDCRYDLASEGASLFERFYRALVADVFGRVCGDEILHFLAAESGILADFYFNFDRILLSAESAWWGPEGRDATFARVAAAAVTPPVHSWGSERQLLMKHLLLGGRLPRWCGFDHGPIALRGSRATLHQGQIYRAGGRDTSFAPSFRLVVDLGTDEAHTAIAGGPSDRRFSRWYTSGVAGWLAGDLKTLAPGTRRRRA
jgi:penicillin G amidase